MDTPKKALIPKALRLKALGYNWMLIFSVGLMVISAWELAVRLDAMKKPLDMFFRLAEGEGIPLIRVMHYFEWDMLEPLLWLAGCILVSLVNLFVCRRPLGSMIMLPFCAALAVYGLIRKSSALPDLWFLAQPALLLSIVAFGIVNLSTYRVRQKRLIFNIRRAGEMLRAQEESDHALRIGQEHTQSEPLRLPKEPPSKKALSNEALPQISDMPADETMLPSTENLAKVYLRQEVPKPSHLCLDEDRPTYPPPRLKA